MLTQTVKFDTSSRGKRPESAQAHFTLAYVLGYIALLDQAAHECDIAWLWIEGIIIGDRVGRSSTSRYTPGKRRREETAQPCVFGLINHTRAAAQILIIPVQAGVADHCRKRRCGF